MTTTNSQESGNIEKIFPSLEIQIPQPLSINTAPNSPVRLSPIHMNLATSKTPNSVSPTRLQLPIAFRAQTEALDKDKDEFESLFSDRIQTDPGDFEDNLQQEFKQKKQGYLDVKRKTSLRSLQNLIDDIKKASGNRSYSATKISKAQKEVSTTPKKGNKVVGEKGKDSKKRPVSSTERINDSRSRSREETGRGGDKKVIKTAVKDLELDFGDGERSNIEGEGPDNLFGEESSEREVHSCKNSRETGPIRYSKMSEEDAAAMFEIRRKELLNFLKKLGANATLIKKKQSYRKPGIPKQGSVSGQQPISELRKSEIEREYRMRAVKETLKESLSPTTFIIYNNNITEQPIWNGPSTAKVRTPLRESSRKQTASLKNMNESVSDAKRRNSVKSYKEKDESNQMVSRNLEASFNKIAQDFLEASEKKPTRRSNKGTERLVGSVEEKREAYESIKIDLKKELLKKKKKKKVEKVEEKPVTTGVGVGVEKVVPKKQIEEEAIQQKNSALQAQAQAQEIQQKTIVNQKLIEDMRKKNQEVLGDIDDLDMQIQRMEAEKDTRQNKNRSRLQQKQQQQQQQQQQNNQKAVVKKKEELPPPPPQEVYEESLEGSYAYTAKMRRSKSRPRSMNMAGSFYSEGLKQQENSQKEVGSAVPRTWKDKNVAPVTNRSRRWDEVESKERQGRETNQKFPGDNNNKQVQQKTNNNPHQKEEQHQQQQQYKGVQSNSNSKWINPKEEKSMNRDTKTTITNEPATTMIKGKRHGGQSTNMKSLDLGRGKVEGPKMDNYKSPKEMREYLSPTNSKLNEKDMMRKNNSYTPTPTLQSTQSPSLTNTTSPISELFPQSKSVVSTESVKNKKQSVESILENSRQKMKKEPNSASSVVKMQARKGSEIDTRSEKSEIMKRNERYSAANIHDHPRSPKISFFDEVKKILKEGGGAKDERRTPTSLPDKSKDNKPLQKSETAKIKKEPLNKPKFDFAPSMDIRSKIYRDSRPLDEMTKSVKIPASGANRKREDLLVSPKDFISVDQRENQSQSTTPISLELQNITNNHKYESVTERPGIGASKSLEKGIRNRIKNLESENLKDQFKSLNKDLKKKKVVI